MKAYVLVVFQIQFYEKLQKQFQNIYRQVALGKYTDENVERRCVRSKSTSIAGIAICTELREIFPLFFQLFVIF